MSVMKVISPVGFTPATLVATNAVNVDPDWVAGTYSLGDLVTHVVTLTTGYAKGQPQARRFESVSAANTAVPGTDSTKWLNRGPANRLAMFDTWSNHKTRRSGGLEVDFLPGDLVTAVGFTGLEGTELTVTVLDGVTPVHTQTVSLQESTVFDLFDYFTAPWEQRTKAVAQGIPCYASSTIRIAVSGANAAIGRVCYGRLHELGLGPQLGASGGVIDYSTKETDEEFGDVEEFVEKPYADEASYVVEVDKPRINAVRRLLTSLRAKPTMWIGSDDQDFVEIFTIFGWAREHRVAVPYHTTALLDIEIEGLSA